VTGKIDKKFSLNIGFFCRIQSVSGPVRPGQNQVLLPICYLNTNGLKSAVDKLVKVKK